MDESILSAVDKLEKDLQTSPKFGSPPSSSMDEVFSPKDKGKEHVMLRRASSDKVLSRQNSFTSLMKQPSFDKFLSLVRLDSTTSLSPVSEEIIPNAGEVGQQPSNGEPDTSLLEGDKRQGVIFNKSSAPTDL